MRPPLEGVRVLNLSINIPADVAASRLAELGAAVTKVEPPTGDPVQVEAPAWYAELTRGHEILALDLKAPEDRRALDGLLAEHDVLITSTRPSALARLGLGRRELEAAHEQLVQVAIVGHAAPDGEVPGHDLTYAASTGLLTPPALPRTLTADIGGAERAVSAALALLLGRGRGAARYAEVALADVNAFFAAPLHHGLTVDGGVLGGGRPMYGIYPCAGGGWVAIAALEPHFAAGVLEGLGLAPEAGGTELAAAFAQRPAESWERWGRARGLPIAAVQAPPPSLDGCPKS